MVSAFHYPALTALAVGLNLSQIGEFVFVLLSVANQQALLADNVYLLLMGAPPCLPGLAACLSGRQPAPRGRPAPAVRGTVNVHALALARIKSSAHVRVWVLLQQGCTCPSHQPAGVSRSHASRVAYASCPDEPAPLLALPPAAGITALTLLVTPLLLQLSNTFLLPKVARGHPNGGGAGDLEMSGGSPSVSPADFLRFFPHHPAALVRSFLLLLCRKRRASSASLAGSGLVAYHGLLVAPMARRQSGGSAKSA